MYIHIYVYYIGRSYSLGALFLHPGFCKIYTCIHVYLYMYRYATIHIYIYAYIYVYTYIVLVIHTVLGHSIPFRGFATTTHCNTATQDNTPLQTNQSRYCNTLQHTATHYITTTHCNTPLKTTNPHQSTTKSRSKRA